jgi:hypothetical protein
MVIAILMPYRMLSSDGLLIGLQSEVCKMPQL